MKVNKQKKIYHNHTYKACANFPSFFQYSIFKIIEEADNVCSKT